MSWGDNVINWLIRGGEFPNLGDELPEVPQIQMFPNKKDWNKWYEHKSNKERVLEAEELEEE